ncbi:hypothetical protein AB9K41_05080, partial [Cribrihabitans sp. XS_ASV171]
TRAALRVWPLVCAAWTDSSRNESATKASHEQLILLGSWSQFCAIAFAEQASPEVLSAAEQAVNAAKTFHPNGYWSNDFQKAANASGFSVGIVTGEATADWVFDLLFQIALFTKEPQKGTSVFISSTYQDADYDAKTLISQPLWHDASPPEGLRPEDIGPTLLHTDPRFDFFRRWYEGLVRGEPLPLELCRRIATQIPRETWESGADQVAEAIARIEAEWLAEQLPQAEEIKQDPSDGRYTVSPIVFDPDDMIDRLFKQLKFALEMALRGHNQSGFNDMCVAFRYLEHTLHECRDDPNAVHMHLRLAREIIEEKLKTGLYRQEDGLTALVVAMERHEVQLRADHPVVRVAHDRFVAQKDKGS